MFYQTLVKRFRFEASPAERSTTFYSVARHVTLASWLLGLILLVRVHSGLIPSSALYLLGLLGTLWGTHCLYRQRTDTRHLAVALGAIAILLAAGAAAGAISQLGLRLGNPFIDATLARADREIGFHSPTVIASLVQLPLAPQVLGVAYLSSFPLLFASIIALALIRKEEETWELVFLFASAIVLSASCAAFFPAEGVFRYMNIASALANKLPMGSGIYHLATLDHYRNAASVTLDLLALQGVVTFPSFHTALALMTTFAWRGFDRIFYPMIGWNSLVIASTIPIGGHYGIDVIGGALVWAALTWGGTRLFTRGRHVR